MTVGTVVEFTAATDVDIDFKGSRPSKTTAVQIGEAFYNAAVDGNSKQLDRLFTENGGTLVRRGLRAYANTVSKLGHKDVAKAALKLRAEIEKLEAKPAKSA